MNHTRIRAIELPSTLEWFNTPEPINIADQRGKVVLLDFWTYCCINCLHVLPDLAYLEQKFPDSLTVIGLHSPKFPNERVAKQLQKAINRYDIRHPVAHDSAFTVWKSYGIRAWPSIILIDPEGYVIGVLNGEGRRTQLNNLIAQHLEDATRKGRRVHSPMAIALQPEPKLPLKFPGKIHASADHLYVSDTGHHRVLEMDWTGKILRRLGSGIPGMSDGVGENAQFYSPQGLVKVGRKLYVADTQNHALRCIDLPSEQVDTIAGSGEHGRYVGTFFKNPLQVALNSPWDLTVHNGILYIAMAGQHQIWSMDLTSQTIGVLAGSGREDIIDGTPKVSAFAQPSGITLGKGVLYIADSETSAVRCIDLQDAKTTTLVGRGLFVFGDQDGLGTQARLQHVLGVAWDERHQGIWVADTYNSKIKWINATYNQVVHHEIGYPLDEPGGISLYKDTLWIANTNAHQILRYDISKNECSPIKITG